MGSDLYFDGLEYLEEVGLKAMLTTGSAISTEVNFDRETDYSEYPAVIGINYWDEPSLKTMENVNELSDWHIE